MWGRYAHSSPGGARGRGMITVVFSRGPSQSGQREDHVEVADGKDPFRARCDPLFLGECLAIRASAFAAGMVDGMQRVAAWAVVHLPAQGGCAADRDGTEQTPLAERQDMALLQRLAMAPHDVSNVA